VLVGRRAHEAGGRAHALIPSNTLLLDEPTNHLDLDSKDILLEALDDYGGTLIFVSHDRISSRSSPTRSMEIGHGEARVFPGTYPEFLWSKEHAGEAGNSRPRPRDGEKAGAAPPARRGRTPTAPRDAARRHEARKRAQPSSVSATPTRRTRRAHRRARGRIAEREQAMKELEAAMAAPGSTKIATRRSPSSTGTSRSCGRSAT
jgi:ATP-binding cassette subfamily F protein 3